jgi:hypothetical protein
MATYVNIQYLHMLAGLLAESLKEQQARHPLGHYVRNMMATFRMQVNAAIESHVQMRVRIKALDPLNSPTWQFEDWTVIWHIISGMRDAYGAIIAGHSDLVSLLNNCLCDEELSLAHVAPIIQLYDDIVRHT